ncbi:winged helix-turn-helix domain-containing protein [Micromonospora sp. WMMA1363]|uniref:winged helix-turn-helix domain-containing protein n=1 Tax=Micromonospora sp. WMMA1363 TaxID=3053985 RepID=UPI00259CE9B0|nr:winged helix-turn-helix domain-containing protein [Micromonospora sp. WMMA1363]MDM4718494.1 winged helix-turn-helix domain-containing protein [Micromonospora sp. WMMA1363]
MLAHPLRLRLLGLLRMDGPATATRLAAKLHTNTGATSYHLRQLADVGLVVEEPDLGTGRQRWWRAAHDVSRFGATDFDDDPDARAAVAWIEANWVRWMAEQTERWLKAAPDLPRPWREAASIGDMVLRLDPARLRSLNEELRQVVLRYRDESTADGADERDVFVFLSAFPRVEE